MESIEEARIREDGSVILSYYYGKRKLIPAVIMEKYGINLLVSGQDMRDYRYKIRRADKAGGEKHGRV